MKQNFMGVVMLRNKLSATKDKLIFELERVMEENQNLKAILREIELKAKYK